MANTGVRHVRCPKCHGVLREPAGVPVYQCGGCGATLRAKSKTRPTETQDVVASSASPSRSGPPPPPPTPSRRLLGSSGDIASSSSTPDATSSRRQEPNPRETSDLVSVNLGRGAKDARASELQVDSSDKRGKGQAELPHAERKKHSGEAAEWKPSRSPPRHHLRQKILKTVDELKGDLSELFSKSPDLKQQQGHAASTVPASSTIVKHRGSTVAAASWRGLPSRRYRRCRADPPVPVRYGCCRHHHGKPECSSCRGHCGRPARAYQEPSSAPRKQGNIDVRNKPCLLNLDS